VVADYELGERRTGLVLATGDRNSHTANPSGAFKGAKVPSAEASGLCPKRRGGVPLVITLAR